MTSQELPADYHDEPDTYAASIKSVGWACSPDEVLAEIDELLKPHGLSVVKYLEDSDTAHFAIARTRSRTL